MQRSLGALLRPQSALLSARPAAAPTARSRAPVPTSYNHGYNVQVESSAYSKDHSHRLSTHVDCVTFTIGSMILRLYVV